MLYARIEGGKAVEFVNIDGDPAGMFHPSLTFISAPPGCQIGWAMVDGDLVAPPVDVDALRAAKRSAIDDAFEEKVAIGCSYGDHVYQIDDASRANIAGVALRAGLKLLAVPGVTWPEGGHPYPTLANVTLFFTPGDFLAMAQTVEDLYSALRVRYRALKNELIAAEDAAAIAAVNPAAGWPA